MVVKDKLIHLEGMTCIGCETRIENKLRHLDGIMDVKVSFKDGTVTISYDDNRVSLQKIADIFEKLDYKVKNTNSEIQNAAQSTIQSTTQAASKSNDLSRFIGIGVIIFAVYLIIENTVGFNFIPEVNQSMGYGILLMVGILTSLHCVAMCGGINLSQCVSIKSEGTGFDRIKPGLLYNLGRVASYTVIGGIVGGIGSVMSFSGAATGIVAILAGVFMVIMGLNMMNIFPALRKLNPRMPKFLRKKVNGEKTNKGPLYVGILNGFMPCGPLQAMQIYALGTGSVLKGAASMFFFGMGTVPLMLGLGAFASYLGAKFMHRMMKVSAVLVVFLGLVMLARGFALSGISFHTQNLESGKTKESADEKVTGNVATISGDKQVITSKITSGEYPPIVVQKGIPVIWTIKADAEDINGCNNRMIIRKFNIEKKLVSGDNIVEFTPNEEGNIPYSCWMGMIRSNIKVVSDLKSSTLKSSGLKSEENNAIPDAGSMGGYCCGG